MRGDGRITFKIILYLCPNKNNNKEQEDYDKCYNEFHERSDIS